MTFLNLTIEDKSPKSHRDSGFLADTQGVSCTCWFLCSAGPGGLAPAPSTWPNRAPHTHTGILAKLTAGSPWEQGRGCSSTRLGRSEKPPLARDREQQTARLVQVGCGNTFAVIRGLQNNLWEETRELGLLSLEKAGNRARHDSAVAVHKRLLLREAEITLLEGQR